MTPTRRIALLLPLVLFVGSCAVLQDGREADTDMAEHTDPGSLEASVTALPESAVLVEYASSLSVFTVALDSEGRVWRFGATDADLGGPPWAGAVNHPEPVQVFGDDANWASAGVGRNHLVLVSHSGELYTWGNNTGLVLGLGEVFSLVRFSVDLNRIAAGEDWQRAYAGEESSFALTTDGRVFAWGNPATGALGIGPVLPDNPRMTRFEYWGPSDRVEELGVPNPQPIADLSGIVDLAVGSTFVLALDRDGVVYSWGENARGQLGTGDLEPRSEPVILAIDASVSQIAAGAYTSFAITDSGEMYGWGGNGYGELPGSSDQVETSPIALFPDMRWRAVATGQHSARAVSDIGAETIPVVYAVSDTGWLYYWAAGESQLEALPDDIGGWVSVMVSESQVMAIRRNGALYTWVHGEPVPPSRLVLR